ncbi:MAG: ArgE/DapE family deacylase [Firmicutes bacterium]|nr:ArgE/DapE family deacylase [Bacillota bacterium]
MFDVEPGVVEMVSATVDSMRDEIAGFLSDIVRIDTENPPGRNYRRCAEAIGDKLKEFGYEVEYLSVPAELLGRLAPLGEGLERVSVVGRLEGQTRRPVLHFTGHFDVVPAGDGWSVDPYGGLVKDGRVYGRGASDQKSGIAAQVFAIEAVRRAGLKPLGTVVSSATPDEETGGFAGIGYLVDRDIISTSNTDYCVITECLDYDKVCIGHRGTVWFEIKTFGRKAHGSMPGLGVNAIDKMVKAINVLNSGVRAKAESLVSSYPVVPDSARRSTMAVTVVQAGVKTNVIPDECRAEFDWRLVPEQDVDACWDELVSALEGIRRSDPEFAYSARKLLETPPTIVPTDTEVVSAFLEAGERVIGRRMGFSVSPGSDDQKFVVQKAGLKQCIVYGPGPLNLAHQNDEYQPVDDLIASTKVMAVAALRLLGYRREKR